MASTVLAPASAWGKTFTAVAFSSSPMDVSFDNVSVFWYAPDSSAEICHSETMKAIATEYPQVLAFSTTINLMCFPEKIAVAAQARGFSAVIWRTPLATPGYTAKCSWGSNSAPIPIFDVSSRSDALQARVTSRIHLVSATNPIQGFSWFGPQIFLLLIMLLVNGVKITVSARAFFPVQLRQVMQSRSVTTAQIVLLSTIVSGVMSTMHSVDFMGQVHVFPLPVWFIAYMWGFLFNFLSTFVLAKALLNAEAAVRGVQFEKSRSVVLNISFAMFFALSLIATILLGFDVFYTDVITLPLNASMFLFQAIVGGHFLLSKRRVLILLQASVAVKENSTIDNVHDLERMSFFLFLSGAFMLSYFLSNIIVTLLVKSLGSTAAVIYGALFSSIFNSLSGLCQVLSLPEKTTGIHYSFRKRTRSSSVLSEVAGRKLGGGSTPQSPPGELIVAVPMRPSSPSQDSKN
eukprot:TRINITY_DN63331_c0_g1_i1.p1 TRINITY_DN63331_c0_g1~~TRINITY_DN63331_c0_g1_i1.p1  ORF type:complete len:461 (+),score=86.81 TRINITY_DN63331_c0_g1_i1:174-1556(+)